MRLDQWSIKPGLTRHQVQEAEANRFAIELLMPARRLRHTLSPDPDLARICAAALEFDVSREAAARRYVELHEATLTIAFSRDGSLRYWARRSDFPTVRVWRDQPMPTLPQAKQNTNLSEIEEAPPDDWLSNPKGCSVAIQTLHQQDGFAMTLVVVDAGSVEDDEDDSDGLEDTFTRFARFSER